MSDRWFDPHDHPHLRMLKAATFALSYPGHVSLRTPDAVRHWLADRLGVGVERVTFSLRAKATAVEEGTSFRLNSSTLGTKMLTEEGVVDAHLCWSFSTEITQEHASARAIDPETVITALSALLPFWIAFELSITTQDNQVLFVLGTSRLGTNLTIALDLPSSS
ncbi:MULTISPECIES: hypothetical protein [unclassified Rhizobium]|uniref:hypothetical protein n=1 Tax=unclassified Rhizobium TaxID=2613769 RepID=UPI0007EA7F0E|nr:MULTISPECIES: hypothetical protein [unclassified Rhizobium]ANM09245.1 hypothetical protein AMK05_CH00816 [Rhizobium sp. N324]OYD02813.1 hypothetical protein AMK08_CH100812 [Rhizobium sp. N4311]